MAFTYKQGYFTPQHPEKYKGKNIDKIVYRSSWELHFNKFLDSNPNVLEWSSECIAIPYVKPTDGRIHRYFPDYWIKYRNKDGQIVEELIEVKPKAQTRTSRRRKPKQKLIEDVQYAINVAKWQAATKWCNERGIKFKIITENSLFK